MRGRALVLAALTSANRAVRTKAEKLMIVSALGQSRRPESPALLKPCLEDPEVRDEAALAAKQISAPSPRPPAAPVVPPSLFNGRDLANWRRRPRRLARARRRDRRRLPRRQPA